MADVKTVLVQNCTGQVGHSRDLSNFRDCRNEAKQIVPEREGDFYVFLEQVYALCVFLQKNDGGIFDIVTLCIYVDTKYDVKIKNIMPLKIKTLRNGLLVGGNRTWWHSRFPCIWCTRRPVHSIFAFVIMFVIPSVSQDDGSWDGFEDRPLLSANTKSFGF